MDKPRTRCARWYCVVLAASLLQAGAACEPGEPPPGRASARGAAGKGDNPGCSEKYPAEGRCEGDLLYYCTDEGPTIWSCAWNGLTCGRDRDVDDGAICVAREDPCQGLDLDGECDAAGRLRFCEKGVPVTVDCAAGGLVCGVVGVRADCRAPLHAGCGGVSAKGVCREKLLLRCSGGVLVGRNCTGRGTIDCVEAPAGARCE